MKEETGNSPHQVPETRDHSNPAQPRPFLVDFKKTRKFSVPTISAARDPVQLTAEPASISDPPVVSVDAPVTSTDAECVERAIAWQPVLDESPRVQIPAGGCAAQHLASAAMSKCFQNGQTLLSQDGRFLHFSANHWNECSDQQIEATLRNVAPEIGLGSEKTTIFREALRLLHVYAKPAHGALVLGAPAPRAISLLNGELCFNENGSVELRAHRPETGLDYVLPFHYDPSATCPIFDQALAAIFANAKDPASLIELAWRMIGYIIGPDRNQPMIVVFIGEGANGKSMLVKIIQRLLSPHAVLFGSLSRMTTAPASLKSLCGKRMFVDTDVAADLVWSDALLKRMSEATPLTVKLGRQGDATFENGAVPLLLCNSPPGLRDVTHGMHRRLVVVPFDRTFAPDEIDTTLFDRIVATELAGILHKAVAGWQRLMRDSRLNECEDTGSARLDLLAAASPIIAFIGDDCVIEKGVSVKRSTFFDAYRAWAEASDRRVGKATSEDLVQLGLRVKKIHGDYFVEGLRLKDERD